MQLRVYTYFLFILVFGFQKLSAQAPTLIEDINVGSESAFNWYNGVQYNDRVLFVASDGLYGGELFSLKGDLVTFVKDIYQGFFGSFINDWVHFNGQVYFEAADSAHGYELWKTDGTEDGTLLVHDINPGADHSFPTLLKAPEGLYISAAGKLHIMPTGTEKMEVIDGVSFPNLSTRLSLPKACIFRKGIAFVANENEIWTLEDTDLKKVHTFTNLPGGATIGGLSSTKHGLTIVIFHEEQGGVYLYNEIEGSVDILRAPDGQDLKPLITSDISREKTILFSFDDGYYMTDGSESGTKKFMDSPSGVLNGGDVLQVEVVGDQYIMAPFGSQGSDRLVAIDTGSLKIEFELPFTESFASPMIRSGQFVIIASGTFTDMKPTIYYYDGEAKTGGILHTFDETAPSYAAIVPVRLSDGDLYFFSNLFGLGRELYRMPTALLSTSVQNNSGIDQLTLQPLNDLGDFKIHAKGEHGILDLNLVDLHGRQIQSWKLRSGDSFRIEHGGFFGLQVIGSQSWKTFKVLISN